MGIFRGDVKEEKEKLVITERHFERRYATTEQTLKGEGLNFQTK
jgi:hypothetical protein